MSPPYVFIHDDMLKESPQERLVDGHEEIGEIAADYIAVVARVSLRKVMDGLPHRLDGPQ